MDGLANAIGAPRVLKARGKEYMLHPLTLENLGTLEAEMLKAERYDPVADIIPQLKELPEALAEKLLTSAIEQKRQMRKNKEPGQRSAIPAAELQDWCDTSVQGKVLAVWLMIRQDPNYKSITLEEVKQILDEVGEEEMKAMMDEASGLQAGESTSPTPEKPAPEAGEQTGAGS